jgi:hypothetical protein
MTTTSTLLDRWRASLDLPPRRVDSFITRHRRDLEQYVQLRRGRENVFAVRLPQVWENLRGLAQELSYLARRLPKTPREIARDLGEQDPAIGEMIDTFLDEHAEEEGVHLEPFLSRLAARLSYTSDRDEVFYGHNEEALVSPVRLMKEDEPPYRAYVLREDLGVERRFVESLGPYVDEDGYETNSLLIRDLRDPESDGVPLAAGDRLIDPLVATPPIWRIELHWDHYHWLAQALRRAPGQLELSRRLLVLIPELIHAAACEGEPRQRAVQALIAAVRAHQRATHIFNRGESAEELFRAARVLTRRAHTIALACAEGRSLSDLDLDHSDPAHLRPGETDPYRHSHHKKRKGQQT